MTRVEGVHAWLQQFATCVRSRDITSGSTLFSRDASGFGTRTRHAHNLAELIELQWIPTWNSTRDFRFLPETVSFQNSEDATLVVVMARWTSMGVTPGGETFPRNGRCTIILKGCGSSPYGYVATHTHFSKDPGGEL